jgi:hypothetical protein
MNNLGVVLVKLTVLAGGAVIGALLARWYDEALSTCLQEKSEHDKTYYARGLPPIKEQKGQGAQ